MIHRAYKYSDDDFETSEYIDDDLQEFTDDCEDLVMRYDKAKPSSIGKWYLNQATTAGNSMNTLLSETKLRYGSLKTWIDELQVLMQSYDSSGIVLDSLDFEDAQDFLEGLRDRFNDLRLLQETVIEAKEVFERYINLLTKTSDPVEWGNSIDE